ncbi:MAG: hypothetical protein NT096_12185 [Proteobacteria bacterium]|nr:hypothetical protein [Pseudomonadota bacterium]
MFKYEIRFTGHVKNSYGWCAVLIILGVDLRPRLFIPMLDWQDEGKPKLIEGHWEDWKIEIRGIPSKISIPQEFDYFDEDIRFTEDEKNVFSEKGLKMLWDEITLQPVTCSFTKVGISSDVPHEWGLTYYPEAENRMLQHFFIESRDDRSPRNLPHIFSELDHSLYFRNVKQWTLSSIHEHLQLLTSCLSFFTGTPLSYERLVGRYEDNVIYIQLRNESNPNAYICPSFYTGRLELKQNALSSFSSVLVMKIDERVKYYKMFEEHANDSNREREKLFRLFSYFKMLYMAYNKEAKIALSYMIMDSLAKFKGMKTIMNSRKKGILEDIINKFSENMCSSCIKLLRKEAKPFTDEFDTYLKKVLDIFELGELFNVDPTELKEIAQKYRNNVFHGDFFNDMENIENHMKTLPEGFQRDLPIVFQSIVLAMGANLILGIEFEEMIAIKRSI